MEYRMLEMQWYKGSSQGGFGKPLLDKTFSNSSQGYEEHRTRGWPGQRSQMWQECRKESMSTLDSFESHVLLEGDVISAEVIRLGRLQGD